MIYIFQSELDGCYKLSESENSVMCEDTFIGAYDPASAGDALRFALDMSRAGDYNTDYIKAKTEKLFNYPPDFEMVWETLRKSEEDLRNDKA